jgi:hypothetical protein
MPKMPLRRPLGEFKLPDQNRFDPATIIHLFVRESLAPAPALRLWEIHERAAGNFKVPKSLKQALPRCRHKAASCSRHIHQPFALVVAEHERVKRIAQRELKRSVREYLDSVKRSGGAPWKNEWNRTTEPLQSPFTNCSWPRLCPNEPQYPARLTTSYYRGQRPVHLDQGHFGDLEWSSNPFQDRTALTEVREEVASMHAATSCV